MALAERISAPPAQGKAVRGRPRPMASVSGLLTGAASLFIETASLIAFVVVAVHLYRGDGGFAALDPNPLWIPVIFLSAQYGALGGTFAALGATAALYGVDMPHRAPSQDFYSYAGALVVQPIQWLTYAIVIGGLRSLHILRAKALQSDLEDANQAAIELADGLERALAEIERLERRIAGEAGTLSATLLSLTELDFRDAGSVVSSFAPIVSNTLNAALFTVYLGASRRPAGCFRFDEEGGASVSKAPKLDASLWKALEEGRDFVGPLDPDRKALLPAGSLCATPIKSAAGGPLLGVLLIEKLRPHREPGEAPKLARLLGLALGAALTAAMHRGRAMASVRP